MRVIENARVLGFALNKLGSESMSNLECLGPKLRRFHGLAV